MNFETFKRIGDLEERMAENERRLQELEQRLRAPEVHEAVRVLEADSKSRPILGLRRKP